MTDIKSRSEKSTTNWFDRQVANFENAQFAWMAIGITFQSCFGSIACMLILKSNGSDVLLSICAAVTMASNALFIAQAPSKWAVGGFYLSVVVNAIIILLHL